MMSLVPLDGILKISYNFSAKRMRHSLTKGAVSLFHILNLAKIPTPVIEPLDLRCGLFGAGKDRRGGYIDKRFFAASRYHRGSCQKLHPHDSCSHQTNERFDVFPDRLNIVCFELNFTYVIHE